MIQSINQQFKYIEMSSSKLPNYQATTDQDEPETSNAFKNGERTYHLPYVIKLTLISTIGGFLFGYDTGVIAGAQLYFENTWPTITELEKGTIVSLAQLGAAVGSLMGGPLSDTYGRKATIMWADVLFSLGAIIMGFAPSIAVLIVGRFVVGLGLDPVRFPLLCSVPVEFLCCINNGDEILFSQQRLGQDGKTCHSFWVFFNLSRQPGGQSIGRVPPCQQSNFPGHHNRSAVLLHPFYFLCITSGQFISYLVCIALGDKWRWMLGIAAVPAILQFIGMFFMPETPVFLYKQGKVEEGDKVLGKLYLAKYAQMKKQEMAHEVESIKQESKDPFFTRVKQLFGVYGMCILIGGGLQFWQQFCGINTVMYFGPDILQKAGFGSDDKSSLLIQSLPLALTNALGTIVAIIQAQAQTEQYRARGPIYKGTRENRASGRTAPCMSRASPGIIKSRRYDNPNLYTQQQRGYRPALIQYIYKDAVQSQGHLPGSNLGPLISCAEATSFGPKGVPVAIIYIDKLGRRYILLRLIPFIAATLLFLAVGLGINGLPPDNQLQSSGKWLSLVGILTYLIFFSISLGPIPWTVNSEIYPLHLRGVGNSLATTVNWVSNYAVSQVFLLVTTTSMGQVITFVSIAVCCGGTWLFVYRLLPETKGRSIESIVGELCPEVRSGEKAVLKENMEQ